MRPSSIIPTPDIFQAKRILCIQPHYDDNDIGAGGSLALLHDLGAELLYLTVTDDLAGVLDPALTAEEAMECLRGEQARSGAIIGVSGQHWLGYPDAGKYDYYDLRRDVTRVIRMLRPDFLFAPNPWLPYEAHRDHILTGQAAAEATILYMLPRLATDPRVDAAYEPHALLGIAFYYTLAPNTVIDITSTCARKEQALRSYQAQFSDEDMQMLLQAVDVKERALAEGLGYSHAEGLTVMHPSQLHCGL